MVLIENMTKSGIRYENWIQTRWRPAIGWTYMIICILDMAVFPIIWSFTQVLIKQPISQWMPLTLQGNGLFHMAMGAVLGIAAFGRTQEKVAGAASNIESPKEPISVGPIKNFNKKNVRHFVDVK